MKRSPARIVELCIYVLIIIAAIIWMVTGGRLYKPPDVPPPTVTETAPATPDSPPIIFPRSEVLYEE